METLTDRRASKRWDGREETEDVYEQGPGLAALSLCESLILALTETGVLDSREARGVLDDAITAHRNASDARDAREAHNAAASLIERIREGVVSVLRERQLG